MDIWSGIHLFGTTGLCPLKCWWRCIFVSFMPTSYHKVHFMRAINPCYKWKHLTIKYIYKHIGYRQTLQCIPQIDQRSHHGKEYEVRWTGKHRHAHRRNMNAKAQWQRGYRHYIPFLYSVFKSALLERPDTVQDGCHFSLISLKKCLKLLSDISVAWKVMNSKMHTMIGLTSR